MIKISIIVPVYNVEEYLDECINSLLNQKYDNYEIIIVDDGSTDNSGKICDEYKKKYDIIQVYHKKNSGLSDTRNYGIKKASGDYLMFVDSDDYIEKNILEKITKKIESSKCNILITRFIEKYDDNSIEIVDDGMPNKLSNKKEFLDWILNKSYSTWPAQKYIVSKDFIMQNNLQFRSGFLHEDLEWTSFLCIYGNNFSLFKPIWYYHRINRAGSITNVMNEKKIIHVIIMSFDLVCGNNKVFLSLMKEDERLMLTKRIMDSFYSTIIKSIYLSNDKLLIVRDKLDENKDLLNYAYRLKHKVFALSIKILGFKKSINLLKAIKKVKG